MCLGTPAEVVEVREDLVLVDYGGIRKWVRSPFLSVRPGETVMVHAGFVISRISREVYEDVMEIWREIKEALRTTSRTSSPGAGRP